MGGALERASARLKAWIDDGGFVPPPGPDRLGTVMAVLLLPLVLGACSAEHRAALAYADDQAKGFKDTEARVLMRAPCAMSVGAYWRALDDDLRKSVDAICKRP
jgi:hypothetical protein